MFWFLKRKKIQQKKDCFELFCSSINMQRDDVFNFLSAGGRNYTAHEVKAKGKIRKVFEPD